MDPNGSWQQKNFHNLIDKNAMKREVLCTKTKLELRVIVVGKKQNAMDSLEIYLQMSVYLQFMHIL